jgi:hypothetical protein
MRPSLAVFLGFALGCALAEGVVERRCVDDVLEDAAVRLPDAMGRDEPPLASQDLERQPLPDLDGDGRADEMVVAMPWCGVTGNCPRAIYLSRNGCAAHGGTLWWAYEQVLPRRRFGVNDLETYTKGGCAGTEGTVARLGWNGRAYETLRMIDCPCMDDDDDGRGRDPACPGAE